MPSDLYKFNQFDASQRENISLNMKSGPFVIFTMLSSHAKFLSKTARARMPRAPILIMSVSILSLIFVSERPSHAYKVYTGIDPNGDPNVNLLPNIPISTAAQNAFLAELQGVGTETFESIPDGQPVPLNLVFPDAGSAILIGADGSVQSTPKGMTTGSGRYGITPTQYLAVNGGSNFRIEFSDPIAAFGFFGIDIGDFGGSLKVTYDNPGIGLQEIPLAPMNQADGSVLFYGIISATGEEFSSVTFHTEGSADMFAFDNMTIGSARQVIHPHPAVPGPLGILGLGAAFRWSRKIRRLIQP